MKHPISDIAFTPAVKAAQERLGSRKGYAGMEERGGWESVITADLAAFIAARDSLYLGTATAEGQPYIQHRGGTPGFLKVIDENTLAMADFAGNRQYISMGNLEENGKAYIFLMDYFESRRIKIWGRAEFIENDACLLEKVTDKDYGVLPQRALRFHVEAWDVNCPKHIPKLYSEAQMLTREKALNERIVALQAECDRLR